LLLFSKKGLTLLKIQSIKFKIKAMQQITLNVEEKYMDTFLAYLKTLKYVKVNPDTLKDARDARKKGFQSIAEDAEMLDLANQDMADFLTTTDSKLSPEQEAELAVAIEESYNPENWVAHEDVMKRVDQWLKR
jgi:hypothetical protein